MSVSVLQDRRLAVLRGASVCYAFAWGEDDVPLRHLHWGGPVSDDDLDGLRDEPRSVRRATSTAARPRAHEEELPVWGGLRREEVAIKVEHADGVRGLELRVREVRVEGEQVVAELEDVHYPVRLRLTWEVDEESDAVVRTASVANTGAEPLVVDQALTASWPVPRRPRHGLLALTGMYGAESRVTHGELVTGAYTVQSRAGIPGHDALPFLAVHDAATETGGEVWSVALAWSGSWRITAQRSDDEAVHVLGGVHDVDLRHALAPGATLDLPPMVGVHSAEGFTGMTDRWHRYLRGRVVRQPARDRPVHYNSWEAAYFDVSTEQQVELARVAADLGVELFVVDDGWFAGRDHDRAGLGDWYADPRRFPDGLGPLADEVRRLGMGFGLWVEPEMVNEDSELFRAHPDWAYAWPTRTPTQVRHQRMLDFSRAEVQDWALETLDGLVADLGLDYLKWDMNRPLAEPYGPNGGEVWLGHVRGLYRVWEELGARHPDLWLETCASGGGRADLGALARAHWAWPSDDTDPLERIAIQEGFTTLNPPLTMSAWVTDSPTPLGGRLTPLRFRFHVAMCGVLALGGDLSAWSEEDRATARELVALYKELRPLVQHGRLLRLPSPAPGRTSVVGFVAPDRRRAAVVVLAESVRHTTERQLVRFGGLDPDATYDVRDSETGALVRRTGAALMGHGLLVELSGSYASTVLVADAR